jgi:hypothetical protein
MTAVVKPPFFEPLGPLITRATTSFQDAARSSVLREQESRTMTEEESPEARRVADRSRSLRSSDRSSFVDGERWRNMRACPDSNKFRCADRREAARARPRNAADRVKMIRVPPLGEMPDAAERARASAALSSIHSPVLRIVFRVVGDSIEPGSKIAPFAPTVPS